MKSHIMNMNRTGSVQNVMSPKMKKSISFSGISSNINHQTSIFYSSILKCPICQSKVQKAHMCPACCKLFCEKCLKNWITNNKPECPNCSRNLKPISIVNCEHLAEEIENAISKNESKESFDQGSLLHMQQSKINSLSSSPDLCMKQSLQLNEKFINTNNCKQHELPLDYYCEQCKVGICPDCAILTNKHIGHKLCKITAKRRVLRQSLQQINFNLGKFKRKVLNLKQGIDQMKNKSHSAENEQINYLFAYIRIIEDYILGKFNEILKGNEKITISMSVSYQQLAAKCKNVEKQIDSFNKRDLIAKADGFDIVFKQIQALIKEGNGIIVKKQKIERIVKPQEDSNIFIIKNYTHFKNKGEMIYSETFQCKNSQWRLKIYPGGLQQPHYRNVQPNLAIYLEMKKCSTRPGIYMYQIQIINQLNLNLKMKKIAENLFEEGICWGYDNFIRISDLYSQKYIHPIDDTLQIKLQVGFPTYFHAIKEKDYQIKRKYEIIDKNSQLIRDLRNELQGHPQQILQQFQ